MHHVAIRIHNYLYALKAISCFFLKFKNASFLFYFFILIIVCVALRFVSMGRKACIEKGARICVTVPEDKTKHLKCCPWKQ